MGASRAWLCSYVPAGAIPKGRLDDAAYRNLLPRFLLGEFDINASASPFWDHENGCSVVGAPAHRQLATEAAQQSLVLLKNRNRVLPLSSTDAGADRDGVPPSKIALLGPFTNATWMYHLRPTSSVL